MVILSELFENVLGCQDSNPHQPDIGQRRVLEADKILAVTELPQGLTFLMKWKDSNLADLILAKDANVRYPQTVIKFYEKQLRWRDCNCNCH